MDIIKNTLKYTIANAGLLEHEILFQGPLQTEFLRRLSKIKFEKFHITVETYLRITHRTFPKWLLIRPTKHLVCYYFVRVNKTVRLI